MHLVGFIIRIYHDALSPEWQMPAGLYRVELGLPTWRKAQPVSILEQVAALFCYAGEPQKSCLKHVEFCSTNKFEKLVHLAGFIIRIQ